jgi:hypothetical protein
MSDIYWITIKKLIKELIANYVSRVEKVVENLFHKDSYMYRERRSAIDTALKSREMWHAT